VTIANANEGVMRRHQREPAYAGYQISLKGFKNNDYE